METRSALTHPIMLAVLALTALLIAVPLLSGLQSHGGHGNMFVMSVVMVLPVLIAVLLMVVTLQHFNADSGDEKTDAAERGTDVDQLQEQYVTGELSEAEFERRLERQLEKEETDSTDQAVEQRPREPGTE